MKADIQAVLERMALAERVGARLAEPAVLLSELPAEADERRWLVVAAERLVASVATLRARVEQGLALPELKALRAEREQQLEQAWVGGVRNRRLSPHHCGTGSSSTIEMRSACVRAR